MNDIEKLAFKLKLSNTKANYKLLISEAMDRQSSYEDFLKLVLTSETRARESNGINRRIRTAKYPHLKYLHDLKLESFPIDVNVNMKVSH